MDMTTPTVPANPDSMEDIVATPVLPPVSSARSLSKQGSILFASLEPKANAQASRSHTKSAGPAPADALPAAPAGKGKGPDIPIVPLSCIQTTPTGAKEKAAEFSARTEHNVAVVDAKTAAALERIEKLDGGNVPSGAAEATRSTVLAALQEDQQRLYDEQRRVSALVESQALATQTLVTAVGDLCAHLLPTDSSQLHERAPAVPSKRPRVAADDDLVVVPTPALAFQQAPPLTEPAPVVAPPAPFVAPPALPTAPPAPLAAPPAPFVYPPALLTAPPPPFLVAPPPAHVAPPPPAFTAQTVPQMAVPPPATETHPAAAAGTGPPDAWVAFGPCQWGTQTIQEFKRITGLLPITNDDRRRFRPGPRGCRHLPNRMFGSGYIGVHFAAATDTICFVLIWSAYKPQGFESLNATHMSERDI
ncbi:hypothetical protein OF83DRAFT_1177763 [Amylostereum chailletii]|nr:hypothetical protein OF83DRAFT_1177763 [Amylostereum chailletii]